MPPTALSVHSGQCRTPTGHTAPAGHTARVAPPRVSGTGRDQRASVRVAGGGAYRVQRFSPLYRDPPFAFPLPRS
eukprot:6635724-Prymnesium_polylepis.1